MCLVSHLHNVIYGLVRVFLNQWRMLNSAADLGVRIDTTISLSTPNNKGPTACSVTANSPENWSDDFNYFF